MDIRWSKTVDRPVDQVFDAFTDLEHAADRIRAIERLELLTEEPVGVGTVFRETRRMFKRECTEEMTITRYEPNQCYVVGAHNCGCDYTTIFEFHPDGNSTRIDVTFRSEPQTFFAKLLSPLGKLMSGSIRKMFEQDLQDLKAFAERN